MELDKKQNIRFLAYITLIAAALVIILRHGAAVGRTGPVFSPVKSLNLVVIGPESAGPGNDWTRLAAAIASVRPDLVFFIGNVPGTERADAGPLEKAHADFKSAFRPVINDIGPECFRIVPGELPENAKKIFEKKWGRTYSSFGFRGCHFILLDSHAAERERRAADEQMKWFANDLQQNARADFTFVAMHTPFTEDVAGIATEKIVRDLADKRVRLLFVSKDNPAFSRAAIEKGMLCIRTGTDGTKGGNGHFLWVSVRADAEEKIKITRIDVVGTEIVPSSEFDLD